jgi:hypothetical protein
VNGHVPPLDPETGKPSRSDARYALNVTTFIVMEGVVLLRFGGRVALVSALGLDFATENPELRDSLEAVLGYALLIGPGGELELFVLAWTAVKVLCLDAEGVNGGSGDSSYGNDDGGSGDGGSGNSSCGGDDSGSDDGGSGNSSCGSDDGGSGNSGGSGEDSNNGDDGGGNDGGCGDSGGGGRVDGSSGNSEGSDDGRYYGGKCGGGGNSDSNSDRR